MLSYIYRGEFYPRILHHIDDDTEVIMSNQKKDLGTQLIQRTEKAKGKSNSKALDALKAGVKRLCKSGGWQDYLDFLNKFHDYSWGNRILIWSQMSTASHCAGFRAWQNKFKRSVVKGQKGLAILAPIIVKDRDSTDKNATKLVGFRVEHVWDISQTEGEDTPEKPQAPKRLRGADAKAKAALKTLRGRAKALDLKVTVQDLSHMPGCGGYLEPATGNIVLAKGAHTSQRAKTLAHEIAHWVLEHGRGAKVNRAVAEVEAESTAYVVMSALGLDAADYSFAYVAGWSGGRDSVILSVAGRVSQAADTILDR